MQWNGTKGGQAIWKVLQIALADLDDGDQGQPRPGCIITITEGVGLFSFGPGYIENNNSCLIIVQRKKRPNTKTLVHNAKD
jgi:hypothetical protein